MGEKRLYLLFTVFLLLFTSVALAATDDFQYTSFSEVSACACAGFTLEGDIVNIGDVPSVYFIELSGNAADWSTTYPNQFSLPAGNTTTVSTFVNVPCDVEGTYLLDTKISSALGTVKQQSTAIKVRSCQVLEVTPLIFSARTCSGNPAYYEFYVRNNGDFSEDLDLTIEGLDDEDYVFNKNRYTIDARSGEKISVSLNPETVGDHTYTLEVEAEKTGYTYNIPLQYSGADCSPAEEAEEQEVDVGFLRFLLIMLFVLFLLLLLVVLVLKALAKKDEEATLKPWLEEDELNKKQEKKKVKKEAKKQAKKEARKEVKESKPIDKRLLSWIILAVLLLLFLIAFGVLAFVFLSAAAALWLFIAFLCIVFIILLLVILAPRFGPWWKEKQKTLDQWKKEQDKQRAKKKKEDERKRLAKEKEEAKKKAQKEKEEAKKKAQKEKDAEKKKVQEQKKADRKEKKEAKKETAKVVKQETGMTDDQKKWLKWIIIIFIIFIALVILGALAYAAMVFLNPGPTAEEEASVISGASRQGILGSITVDDSPPPENETETEGNETVTDETTVEKGSSGIWCIISTILLLLLFIGSIFLYKIKAPKKWSKGLQKAYWHATRIIPVVLFVLFVWRLLVCMGWLTWVWLLILLLILLLLGLVAVYFTSLFAWYKKRPKKEKKKEAKPKKVEAKAKPAKVVKEKKSKKEKKKGDEDSSIWKDILLLLLLLLIILAIGAFFYYYQPLAPLGNGNVTNESFVNDTTVNETDVVDELDDEVIEEEEEEIPFEDLPQAVITDPPGPAPVDEVKELLTFVEENNLLDTFEYFVMEQGDTVEYDLNPYFVDPDNDPLLFTVESQTSENVSISIWKGVATIYAQPDYYGITNVTFVAEDPSGETVEGTTSIIVKEQVLSFGDIWQLYWVYIITGLIILAVIIFSFLLYEYGKGEDDDDEEQKAF